MYVITCYRCNETFRTAEKKTICPNCGVDIIIERQGEGDKVDK